MKIQIILGSTRPGRAGEAVAKWTAESAKHADAEFELVDIKDYDLPLLDEPMPASMHQYQHEHTKKWSQKIDEADGYIFVTPEYNHSVPGAFKNAVDYLYSEWANKAVGFIGYGASGASRAIEHWRGIAAQFHLADVRESLHLSLATDFENFHDFKPTDAHAEHLQKGVDEVVAWSGALKTLRS